MINANNQGIETNEIAFNDIFSVLFLSIIVMLLISLTIFILFRWGFRRLYGNYIHKLKATLKELQGIDE